MGCTGRPTSSPMAASPSAPSSEGDPGDGRQVAAEHGRPPDRSGRHRRRPGPRRRSSPRPGRPGAAHRPAAGRGTSSPQRSPGPAGRPGARISVADDPGPPRAARASRAASTSPTVRVGSAAGVASTPASVRQPTPIRPWRGSPVRMAVATGTSSGGEPGEELGQGVPLRRPPRRRRHHAGGRHHVVEQGRLGHLASLAPPDRGAATGRVALATRLVAGWQEGGPMSAQQGLGGGPPSGRRGRRASGLTPGTSVEWSAPRRPRACAPDAHDGAAGRRDRRHAGWTLCPHSTEATGMKVLGRWKKVAVAGGMVAALTLGAAVGVNAQTVRTTRAERRRPKRGRCRPRRRSRCTCPSPRVASSTPRSARRSAPTRPGPTGPRATPPPRAGPRAAASRPRRRPSRST